MFQIVSRIVTACEGPRPWRFPACSSWPTGACPLRAAVAVQKNDIGIEADLAQVVQALRLLLDAVDDDVKPIGAANYLTIEQGLRQAAPGRECRSCPSHQQAGHLAWSPVALGRPARSQQPQESDTG